MCKTQNSGDPLPKKGKNIIKTKKNVLSVVKFLARFIAATHHTLELLLDRVVSVQKPFYGAKAPFASYGQHWLILADIS